MEALNELLKTDSSGTATLSGAGLSRSRLNLHRITTFYLTAHRGQARRYCRCGGELRDQPCRLQKGGTTPALRLPQPET